MEEYIGKGAAISMVQWIMSDSPSITREDWNAVVDEVIGNIHDNYEFLEGE